MALAIAVILFLIYLANVVAGAMTSAPFVGDVYEMLILFAASIFFVAAILRREADAKKDNET